MGKSKSIKNAMKTILTNIQYGGEPAFTTVLDSGSGTMNGYPIAQLLPGSIDSEKSSVAQNRRTVALIVRVFIPLEENSDSDAEIIDRMYDLTDLIMDTLDIGDYTRLLDATDTSLNTTIMNCTRGYIEMGGYNGGQGLVCDVNVAVDYLKDLN